MRRVLGVMAVTAMLMAACGGDKKDVKASDSDETTSTTASAETTVTTAAGGAATTVAGGAKTPTTVRGGATATTASGSVTSKAPTPAAPGTYYYAQSGTSSTGSIPAEGKAVIDPANASGVQVIHRWIDPGAQPVDTTIAYRNDGPFITDVITRQQQLVVSCHFDPPIAAPPWPAAAGKPISGKANCGNSNAEVTGSITGFTKKTIDGVAYDVVVATVTIKTTGQIQSTSTETRWWSPALRLEVHSESKTSGRFGAFPFESNITSDLKSAKPR